MMARTGAPPPGSAPIQAAGGLTTRPPLTTPSTTPDAPVTDAASGTVEVTRSEEQLRLTTQSVPVGGMRVRKRIVTEKQTAPCRCVARRSWSTTTGRRHTTLTPAGGRASDSALLSP